GGTGSSWVIHNLTSLDADTYSVTVSGACNAVTNVATLSVNRPTTATALASQSVCFGRSATFDTTAGGTGPFSYVWKRDGLLLPGQTISSMTLNHLKAADAGAYTVEVSGQCGAVTNSGSLAVQSDGFI